MEYTVLVFESTHKVLKAEKLLNEIHIVYEIIPTPKDISSDCGMSIRLKPEQTDIDYIKNYLNENNVVVEIYKREITGH